VFDNLRIFIFRVTDRINAPVRHSIGVVQSNFLSLSVIQCTGVYMFCNAEDLLFTGDRKWEDKLFVESPFPVYIVY
jgi:hypothetical protein